jgi:hypothetical protein
MKLNQILQSYGMGISTDKMAMEKRQTRKVKVSGSKQKDYRTG